MCSLFCCFKFLVCCGCRDKVISKYAFYPPKDGSYRFKELSQSEIEKMEQQQAIQASSQNSSKLKNQQQPHKNSKDTTRTFARQNSGDIFKENNIKIYRLILLGDDGTQSALPNIPDLNIKCFKVPVYQNNIKKPIRNIAALYLKFIKQPSDYIIIFSHGNSTDLGYMLDSYLDLSYNCRINLFAYDYSGYGISDDKPSDLNIIQDIQAAYNFVRYTLNYDWSKIIVYGQSLGSGPSTFLSACQEYPVGGLVIHSGYASGLRIMIKGLQQTHNRDFFPNIELINFINCPIFIIHGTKDNEINVVHAQELEKRIKRNYPVWYVNGGGHNNIEIEKDFRRDYFVKLRDFLTLVKNLNKKYSKEQMLINNKADPWNNDMDHMYNNPDRLLQHTKFQKVLKEKHENNDCTASLIPEQEETKSEENFEEEQDVVKDDHLKQHIIQIPTASFKHSNFQSGKSMENQENSFTRRSFQSIYQSQPARMKEIIKQDDIDENYNSIEVVKLNEEHDMIHQQIIIKSQVDNKVIDENDDRYYLMKEDSSFKQQKSELQNSDSKQKSDYKEKNQQ